MTDSKERTANAWSWWNQTDGRNATTYFFSHFPNNFGKFNMWRIFQ